MGPPEAHGPPKLHGPRGHYCLVADPLSSDPLKYVSLWLILIEN